MAKTDVTATRVRELLHYEPSTGVFTWNPGRRNAGKTAGTPHIRGYLTVKVDGVARLAHRLAWTYMTGNVPAQQIDHINGVKTDNRFSNLRDVSPSVNTQNRHKPVAGNKVGLLGVVRDQGAFVAFIKVDGVKKNLGRFASAELAHEAYLKAKRTNHPGCTL